MFLAKYFIKNYFAYSFLYYIDAKVYSIPKFIVRIFKVISALISLNPSSPYKLFLSFVINKMI